MGTWCVRVMAVLEKQIAQCILDWDIFCCWSTTKVLSKRRVRILTKIINLNESDVIFVICLTRLKLLRHMYWYNVGLT